MKKTVMVINDIFTNTNMLIIRDDGSETINRFVAAITSEVLSNELERLGINKEDCDIIVVGENWKGEVRVEKV